MLESISPASKFFQDCRACLTSYFFITMIALNLIVAGGLAVGGVLPYSYLGPIGGSALIAAGATILLGETYFLIKSDAQKESKSEISDKWVVN